MAFLTIGVPETYRNITSVLNKVEYLDLLHNIGQKLRLIGSLNMYQKSNVVKQTEKQGYIQGHILGWTELDIISSTWDSLNIPYWIAIHLVEPDVGMISRVLEENELCNLVQELGIDLHELWKLGMSNVSEFFEDLAKRGFVKSFQGLGIAGYSNSDRVGQFDTNIAQVPPLPPYHSLPMTHPTLSSPENYPPGAGMEFDSFMDYNNGIGIGLSSPWMPNTVYNGDSQPVPAVEVPNSLEPTNWPGGAVSYPVPTTQYLGASQVVPFTPYSSVNSLVQAGAGIDPSQGYTYNLGNSQNAKGISSLQNIISAGAASPHVPVITPAESVGTPPELDWGASCFPTPSTHSVNTPPSIEEPLINAAGPTSDQPTQQQTLVVPNPCQAIFQQLQLCRFGKKGTFLNDEKIQTVVEVEARLFTYDPLVTLFLLLSQWQTNLSHGLNGLGLPLLWKGVDEAVKYLQELDKPDGEKKAKTIQETIMKRFALIFISLNYKELCRHPVKYSRCPEAKANVSSILNSILDAYPDDPRILNERQSRRNKISANYVKRGNWLWRMGCSVGFWVWLIEEDLIQTMANESFTDNQIDALATLSLNTRPEAIRVLRSLDSVVESMILGNDPGKDLKNVLDMNLFAAEKLARAHEKDQKALAHQWTVQDTRDAADKKMTELLALIQ